MTTYTAIPDANFDVDKPMRSVDGLLMRDNPIAIAEGASGAPRNQPASFNNYTAGTVAVSGCKTSTSSDTYIKVYETYVPRGGVLSTTISISAVGGTAFARIYVNGVAVGTQRSTASSSYVSYDEDVTISTGDFLQCYLRTSNPSFTANLLLSVKTQASNIYELLSYSEIA